MLFTPRPIAARKTGIVGWALALAGGCRVVARAVRPRGNSRLGLSHTPSLGAATPISPALVAAFLLAVGRPPVLPVGSPLPPSPCRRAAFGTAVPSLRMSRSEGLLTPLEQTPPLSGPTRPLTGSQRMASVEWAQGSGELPTARPRARSPFHSAPRLLVSSHRPSWSIPSPYPTTDPPANQQARATSPKPAGFGLTLNRPKQ